VQHAGRGVGTASTTARLHREEACGAHGCVSAGQRCEPRGACHTCPANMSPALWVSCRSRMSHARASPQRTETTQPSTPPTPTPTHEPTLTSPPLTPVTQGRVVKVRGRVGSKQTAPATGAPAACMNLLLCADAEAAAGVLHCRSCL
jgi:hypothetical protein